jgi:dethiobiotin synthetase
VQRIVVIIANIFLMEQHNYFITGISTDVGKTIVAAIITEALQADYWKPIQTGAGEHGDARTVQSLVTNKQTIIHPECIVLKAPMSPHAAAALENITLDVQQVIRPVTENSLVIEGAGGLLVPINNKHSIIDLIKPTDKVIMVSSGYLGSINHTLLSLEVLKNRGLTCVGIIYNQVTLPGTIEVIEAMTGIATIGHLEKESHIDKVVVLKYAASMRDKLKAL